MRARALLAAVAVVSGALMAPPTAPAKRSAGDAATRAGAAVPTGTVPSALFDRYLARRPTLGPVTVVNISGESNDRRLLAATLQGVVNRASARIYLLGARSYDEDKFWLDHYVAEGLLTVSSTVNLDTAIHTFKGEVDGYVLASNAEPWTINTATSVAGVTASVIATADTVGVLQSEGLTEIADHRGQWPDGATAYEAIAEQYKVSHPFAAVAIQHADRHMPRDFFVQQGVFTVFTRPSNADYDRVYDVLETFPNDRPVYGYISDTGSEEVEAIVRLSRTGRYLVPTDGTDNLSFHIAVGGSQRALPPDPPADVAPCSADTVNVVIAFSDGDNLGIPEAYYPKADRWGSSRRGELPIGWGITPGAAVLMPAIWDYYASTTTPGDEIVDIMGLGYALPSLMPDGASYLADGMRLRSTLGVRTHWSLDALISKPDADGWAEVHDAVTETGAGPSGIFLNYAKWPGPAWFHTVDGIGVLASQQGAYESTPADLAAQVQDLVDLPDAERSLVNFIPATVWQATYDSLADAMAPYSQQGVRFLTPSEAFACLPAPPVVPTTSTTTPGTTTTTAVPAPGADPVADDATYVG